MAVREIKGDLQDFQEAVRRLSSGIVQASSLWSDAKFAELSASVEGVAVQARDLMVAGDGCCQSLDGFDAIAAERY